MNPPSTRNGVAPQSWLRHYVPWFGLLALVLDLFGEDAAMTAESDEMNG